MDSTIGFDLLVTIISWGIFPQKNAIRSFQVESSSYSGGAKVMIVWLPELLGKEGNRLLKTIEEPRGETYFLFVTEEPDKIIQTILSRCQQIKLGPLDDDSLHLYAKQHMDLDEESREAAIFLADGSITSLIELAQDSNKWIAKIFIDWLRVCFRGKPKEMVDWVDSINTGRSKMLIIILKWGVRI